MPIAPDGRRRFPHNIIQKFLRDQLGFDNGLVMTDDLDMGAILNEVTFEQTIRNAVIAGNDLCMICHRIEMVEEARQHLEKVPEPNVIAALDRIDHTKKKMVKPNKFSLEEFQPHQLRTSGICASPP